MCLSVGLQKWMPGYIILWKKKSLTWYAFLIFSLFVKYEHGMTKNVDIAMKDIFIGSAGD